MSAAARRYAEDTKVPVEKSIDAIEKSLTKYKCTAFQRGWIDGEQFRREIISFEAGGRRIRFELNVPHPETFRYTPQQLRRVDRAMMEAFEQERRRLWRVLEIAIKAKLAAIDSGLVAFDDEFLAYTVMPNNQTVGQWAREQMDRSMREGRMPPLLPDGR